MTDKRCTCWLIADGHGGDRLKRNPDCSSCNSKLTFDAAMARGRVIRHLASAIPNHGFITISAQIRDEAIALLKKG